MKQAAFSWYWAQIPAERAFMTFALRPLLSLIYRMREAFRSTTTWFEFWSGVGILLHGATYAYRPPHELASMQVLLQLFPGAWWPIISVAVGLIQVIASLANLARFKVAAAFLALFWSGLQVCFSTEAVGVTSNMMQLATWGLAANLAVIYRHAGRK